MNYGYIKYKKSLSNKQKDFMNIMNRCHSEPLVNNEKISVVLEREIRNQLCGDCNGIYSYFDSINYKKKGRINFERIYFVSLRNNVFHFEEIMIVPESNNIPVLSKNCYSTYNSFYNSQALHIIGQDKKKDDLYGYDDFESRSDFFDFSNIDPFFFRRKVINEKEIGEKDPSLKYCSYSSKASLSVIEYIRIYRQFPICELLMKCEIYGMFKKQIMTKLTKDKGFRKYVMQNKDALYCFNTREILKNYKNKIDLNKEFENKRKELIESRKWNKFRISSENMELLKKHTNIQRIEKYLNTNHIEGVNYNDYVTAASYLKLDFSDTKVLFPRNFKMYHNYYTRKHKLILNEDIDKQIKEVQTRFSFLEIETENFTVKVAASSQDMIDEGNALHHCVGRMGYNKKMAEGKSLICFIRNTKEPQTPYVTVELKPSKTLEIVQRFAIHNSCPNQETLDFIKKWNKDSSMLYKKMYKAA